MDKDREMVEIRYPAVIRIIGWFSILFGAAMTCFCVYSHFRGNETATVEVMFLFLGLFGFLGAFLVIYGGRSVTVCGADIVVCNGLAGKRTYCLNDVKNVKVRWNGIIFYGQDGILFKLYDRTMECEQFLGILEKNGIEIDSADRAFSRSQMEALNPVVEQRRFTVKLGWFAALILNAAAVCCLFLPFILMTFLPWPAGLLTGWPAAAALGAAAWVMRRVRLEVRGSCFELYRTFDRHECHTTEDLKEVVVKPWRFAHRSVFGVKVISREGRLLFRLSCPALGYEDRNYVLAMLKYFRDCHVPVKGLENLDEGFRCMMERDYVTEEEGIVRSLRVYDELERMFEEFALRFSACGVTLSYGLLDREKRENCERGMWPAPECGMEFWYGVYFCLLKDGRILKMKGMDTLLYHGIVLLRGQQGETGKLFFFTPAPLGGIHNILTYLLRQTEKKQVYCSDQELNTDLDGRGFANGRDF